MSPWAPPIVRFVLSIVFFIAAEALAAEYHVSPTGNDGTGDGTAGNPWRTIRYALDRVFPGDVLFLREGIYGEQLISIRSGSPGAYITIAAYGGDQAYIDGAGVTSGNNGSIIAHSYLRIRGLTFRNWLHNAMEVFDCEFIELVGLSITAVSGGIHMTQSVHDFLVDSCTMYDYYGGAGGMGFDATPENPTDSIYNGIIRNSKAYLTGGAFDNCDGFALGHDGVSNILFQNCETYGVGDGFDISGTNIVLERCSAHDCTFGGGYKLWRENVTLVNCVGYNNVRNVELDFDWGTNRGVRARLINCTLFSSMDANVEIENTAGGSTLEMYNCILAGGANKGLSFDGIDVHGYAGDYNLFHNYNPVRAIATSDPEFSLEALQGGQWTAFSSQDMHSRVVFGADSLFADTLWTRPDLHLTAGAAAIDAGMQVPAAPSVDFDNCPRNVGPIDIGAYEYGACGPTGVGVQHHERPVGHRLRQNYPNPFNPTTVITYDLSEAADVKLEIFDALGRTVSVLVDERRAAGTHETRFDASSLPSGVYFYRLRVTGSAGGVPSSAGAVGFSRTLRLVLLR